MVRYGALIVLLIVCFTAALGAPGLWEKDEGRYSQAAREMRRSGDLLVPTLGGVTRLNKPPLFYWLIAASQATLGENEFACRLPSAVAGVLTALLVFLLARRLAGERAGWFAAIVYATTLYGAFMGRLAHPESWLNLSITASLVLFWFALKDGLRRKRLLVLAWLAAGAGFLAKGPHGVLLPLLVVGVYLLLRRDLRTLPRLMLGRGILVAILPVAAWSALVVASQGTGVLDEWTRETFGRVSGAEDFHPSPPWFFAPKLLGGFMPWTIWLPAAFAVFRGPGRRPEGGAFLLAWAATIFVFFSASPNKASSYVLSTIPPLAVAVGVGLARLRPSRLLTGTGVAVLLVAVGGAVAGVVPLPKEAVWYRTEMAVLGGAAFLAWGATAVLLLLRRTREAALAATGSALVTLLIGVVVVAPAVSPLHSTKEAAAAIRKTFREGDIVANIGTKRAGLLWHTDLPIDRRFERRDAPDIWLEEQRYIIFGRRRWRDALEARGLKVHRIWEHPARKYCVYANRP